jgi:hypothetical protein
MILTHDRSQTRQHTTREHAVVPASLNCLDWVLCIDEGKGHHADSKGRRNGLAARRITGRRITVPTTRMERT